MLREQPFYRDVHATDVSAAKGGKAVVEALNGGHVISAVFPERG